MLKARYQNIYSNNMSFRITRFKLTAGQARFELYELSFYRNLNYIGSTVIQSRSTRRKILWLCFHFRCFSFADLAWYERKIAAVVFGSPPESTYEEVITLISISRLKIWS